MITPDPQLQLHSPDYHLVNTLILLVKLLLFVVHPVQKVLDIGNLGFLTSEVVQQSFMEHHRTRLLVKQRLHLVNDKTLFDLSLNPEHPLKYLEVLHLQKL